MSTKPDLEPTPLGSTLKPTPLMPSHDWGFRLGIRLVLPTCTLHSRVMSEAIIFYSFVIFRYTEA